MPYWDKPRYNDPDEVEGPDDVKLPSTMHHMQAKAELDLLIRAGSLTVEDAEEVMRRWRADGEIGDDDRLKASIRELESRGIIDDDEAERMMEEITP